MMQKVLITLLLLLASGAGFCAEDTTATLQPSVNQDDKVYPYRNAVLTVNNTTEKSIGVVELQDSRGGPGMVFPTVIVPDTSARVDVYLPAISLVQNFNIKLLQGDNSDDSPIAVLKSQISWPPDLLTTDVFFDPQVFESYEESPLLWDNNTKSKAFVLLGIAAVGMSGVLLVRKTWLRIVLLVALIVSVCVADLMIRIEPFEIVTDPQGFIILSTRQTICVNEKKSSRDFWQQKIAVALQNSSPVYPGYWAYREEDMIVHPTKGLSFTLKPRQLRIFRKIGNRHQTTGFR